MVDGRCLQILLELQSSDHSSVTDLAGDAGAVGRIIIANGSSAAGKWQQDWKGRTGIAPVTLWPLPKLPPD